MELFALHRSGTPLQGAGGNYVGDHISWPSNKWKYEPAQVHITRIVGWSICNCFGSAAAAASLLLWMLVPTAVYSSQPQPTAIPRCLFRDAHTVVACHVATARSFLQSEVCICSSSAPSPPIGLSPRISFCCAFRCLLHARMCIPTDTQIRSMDSWPLHSAISIPRLISANSPKSATYSTWGVYMPLDDEGFWLCNGVRGGQMIQPTLSLVLCVCGINML